MWVVLLLLLCGLLYLNQVGLPGFVKRPLLARLQERGLDLKFSRLRLRFYEGIVAEQVEFGTRETEQALRFTAKDARVVLGWRPLLHGNLQVDSLIVRGGELHLSVLDTNQPARELQVSDIQTELRLLKGDEWLLNSFHANFAGVEFQLSANVTNASAFRSYLISRSEKKGAARNRWKEVADMVDRIELDKASKLTLTLQGDAKDPRSFSAKLDARTPSANTPWGHVSDAEFSMDLNPTESEADASAHLDLKAQSASTRWGAVQDFRLLMDLAQSGSISNEVSARLDLTASEAQSKWASGKQVQIQAKWLHSVTNPLPLWATAKVSLVEGVSPWCQARRAVLTGEWSSTNAVTTLPGPELAWWTNFIPYTATWECDFENASTPKIEVHSAHLAGSWAAPNLTISSATAKLYDGQVKASGSLNIVSRESQASAFLDFDVRRAERLLTKGANEWIAQFSWGTPPLVNASAKAILPAWTNRQPDWRGEVRPTLWLSGDFVAPKGAGYNGLEALSATSHFIYSNMTWNLPDLSLTRPEGRLLAQHVASDRTRDYYWNFHSTFDPMIIRALLETNQTRVFDLIQLSSPPEISAEVWGRFHDHSRLAARAHFAVTNFSFRGQSATRGEAEVTFSNNVVRVIGPKMERGAGEHGEADEVIVDINKEQVIIRNARGSADPLAISRAIGPGVGEAMENYIFERPPKAHVDGVIPMHGEMGADLKFDIDGGPFHWWKFHIPHISGQVQWKDQQLSLSGIKADFYHGDARGFAVFDLSDVPGTEFMFSMQCTNVQLRGLLADLSTSTNKSEGWVDGSVYITKANSDNWRTVQGHGNLYFHDGLLWDIPLFGVLSPVLDGIVPGLGNSKATEGTCSYVITNGIFRTQDLDIHTPTMRLQYRGDVDLAEDFRLDSKVEAQLLKDMPILGPLVSTVLWPVTKVFEYKVEGTLASPKLEPVNLIPKIILLPFRPFKSLRSPGPDSPQQGF